MNQGHHVRHQDQYDNRLVSVAFHGVKDGATCNMGDSLHSRALAYSRAPLFTQPCPHCSHSRAPGEQWARLCVFSLQGCVQAARLCRGSPVMLLGLLKPAVVGDYCNTDMIEPDSLISMKTINYDAMIVES